jgi:hypothetical protein
MAYADLFSSSHAGQFDRPFRTIFETAKSCILQSFLLARFISVSYSRVALVKPACEAVKTAPLLVVDQAVEAMNKAKGSNIAL